MRRVDPRTLGAKCDECPLNNPDFPPVLGTIPLNPLYAIVGEAPGPTETSTGVPFDGPTGKLLTTLLQGTGIDRSRAIITNAVCCQPPGISFEAFEARQKMEHAERQSGTPNPSPIECCAPRLNKELLGVTNVISMGARALQAVWPGKRRSLDAMRGGPLRLRLSPENRWLEEGPDGPGEMVNWPIRRLMPTVHPARLFPGREPKWTRPFRVDLAKANRLFEERLTWKEPAWCVNPPIPDIAKFLGVYWNGQQWVANPNILRPLAYDFETNSREPMEAQVYCIGIGTATEAIVIAIQSREQGHRHFWSPADEATIKEIIKAWALGPAIKLGWNSLVYDTLVFRNWLGIIPAPQLDGIYIHRNLEGEMPHSLGHVAGMYLDITAWKAGKEALDELQVKKDFDLWRYNMRDVAATYAVLMLLSQDSAQRGHLGFVAAGDAEAQAGVPIGTPATTHIVGVDHEIGRICRTMKINGMLVHQARRQVFWEKYAGEEVNHAAACRKIANDPSLNINSNAQVARLLFSSHGWRLPHSDDYETVAGLPSVGEEATRWLLRQPFLDDQQRAWLQAYRRSKAAGKIRSTYLERSAALKVDNERAEAARAEEQAMGNARSSLRKLLPFYAEDWHPENGKNGLLQAFRTWGTPILTTPTKVGANGRTRGGAPTVSQDALRRMWQGGHRGSEQASQFLGTLLAYYRHKSEWDRLRKPPSEEEEERCIIWPDGRVHADWKAHIARTGRVASSPNLQNCFLERTTELLTPRGWVLVENLRDGDQVMQWVPGTGVRALEDGQFAWVVPIGRVRRPLGEEPALRVSTMAWCSRTTAGHRLPTITPSGKLDVLTAATLVDQRRVIQSGWLDGVYCNFGDGLPAWTDGFRRVTETRPPEELVHCVTVPSGFVLVRCGGQVHVSGNCPIKIRSMFIPGVGHVFVYADADQLELRIAADRWGAARYLEAFKTFKMAMDNGKMVKFKMDPHQITMELVWGDEIWMWDGAPPLEWRGYKSWPGGEISGLFDQQRNLGKKIQYACCRFSTEVAVLGAEGSKRICDLLVGDDVWSWSNRRQRIEPSKVTAVISNGRRNCVKVTYQVRGEHNRFENASDVFTLDHRIMLRDGTYKAAGQLTLGDRIMPFKRLLDECGHEVVSVEPAGVHEVWDIEVDHEDHNFALASGIFVHNSQYAAEFDTVFDLITSATDKEGNLIYLTKQPDEIRPLYEKWLVNCSAFPAGWKVEEAHFKKYNYLAEPITGRCFYFLNGPNLNEFANLVIQCVPGNTRVITRDGYLPIRDLVGRRFLAWTGTKWASATAIEKGYAELRPVQVKRGVELVCDASHGFKAVGTGAYEWRRADELLPNMRVAIDLARPLEFGASASTEDAYMLGLWLGDGSATHSSEHEIGLAFAVGDATKVTEGIRGGEQQRERIIRWGASRGMVFTETALVGCHSVTCYTGGRDWLRSWGADPAWRSHTKRIPSSIWGVSLAARKAFALGLLDADGYQHAESGHVILHLCQKEVLEELWVLLRTVGIDSVIYGPHDADKKGHIAYSMQLNASQVASELGWGREIKMLKAALDSKTPVFEAQRVLPRLRSTSLGDNVIKSRLNARMGTTNPYVLRRMGVDDIYDHTTVTSVGSRRVQVPVYTLCVDDDDHQYVANGFISKNSSGAGIVNRVTIAIDKLYPLQFAGEHTGLNNQCHDALLLEVPEHLGHQVADDLTAVGSGTSPAYPDVEFIMGGKVKYAWEETKEDKGRHKKA